MKIILKGVMITKLDTCIRFYFLSNARRLTLSKQEVFIFSTSHYMDKLAVIKGYRGRDRMVVGSTTTYAIGAYHH